MICVYDIGNDNYTGNGDAVLVPTEAKLKMIAGGNYDLTMTHPMDPDGKWKHLVPGAIVKVPVPAEEIENAFAGMEADVYKVTTATDLREGPTEPSTITYQSWSISAYYSVGDKVSHNNKNYQCHYYDDTSAWAHIAPGSCNWWTEITRSTPGAAVLVSLPVGSELYYVEDIDSSWYKMSTYYGIVGYVKKEKVTYDRHLTPSETKPRFITEQLMRITNAAADTKNRTVSVTAQHVSYDLNGVIIKDVSIAVASPGMALARIVDSFMIPYPGTIATNLDSEEHGTYTGDIKGKSGMYALLDPDKGIVGTFDAAFRRDNWDLFVMERTNTDRGFQLRRQKNLLGVNLTQKSDSLINRVVPVAKDEGGADLYLPEVWIDSPTISSYPVIRMEMLSMKEQVGKDKGTGDGSTWTEADLLAEMRTRAAERFSVDKVDQVITEVTVDFEMLGATAEYPELRALESVLLYDKVTVIDETIGLETQLTVTELEWDALKKKVTALKISNAEDHGKRSVTGYNVQAKSIGWSKLTDEVQQGIMGAVKDIIPEYTDPNASRPATVTVTDGDPTLAWNTRSKVGTVQGTDLHVTMPERPAYPNRAPLEGGTNESIVTDGEKYVWTYREGFTLINTTTDADTLTTPDEFTRRLRGDDARQLTHGPVNENIPWALESFILGSNIHYQRQICYIYSETGILRYERQGIYTGTGSTGFGWTAWASDEVAIDALNSQNNSTNDILADALACTGSMFFKGSGSNYTGNVPTNNFKYGIFIVNVRGSNVRFVIAQDQGGSIATNAYDGSNWSGWEILAQKDELDTLSSKMNIPSSSGTYATLSALETYLTSVFNGLSVGGTKNLHIITSSSFDNSVFNKGERYVGTLEKYTTDQFVCELASRLGDSVQIGYYNGTYTVINLNSKIADFGTYTQLLGSTNTTGEKTLSDSYQNYRYILLVLFGSSSRIYTSFIPSTLLLPSGYRLTVIGDSNNAAIVRFVSNTTVDIISAPDNIRIYGIK